MNLTKTGNALMAVSTVITVGCLVLVFTMERSVAVPFLVLGHAAAMLSAVGVKLGYIIRLEGQARKSR